MRNKDVHPATPAISSCEGEEEDESTEGSAGGSVDMREVDQA